MNVQPFHNPAMWVQHQQQQWWPGAAQHGNMWMGSQVGEKNATKYLVLKENIKGMSPVIHRLNNKSCASQSFSCQFFSRLQVA